MDLAVISGPTGQALREQRQGKLLFPVRTSMSSFVASLFCSGPTDHVVALYRATETFRNGARLTLFNFELFVADLFRELLTAARYHKLFLRWARVYFQPVFRRWMAYNDDAEDV